MRISHIMDSFVNFRNEYLYSRRRRIEFWCCVALQFAFWVLQASSLFTIEWKALIGNLQGFVSIYLSFRFGIVGIAISYGFFAKDMIFITIAYFKTNHYSYLIGLVFAVNTIMWATVMGILSNRQEKHRREMQRLAVTDDLTGLYNQRFFHSTLEAEIKNASKSGSSVGLIMIDIDSFRMYNDLYGLEYGDTILKNTATVLKQVVNEEDKIFRLGGDEFAIIVKGKDLRSLEREAKLIYESHEKKKKEFYSTNLAGRITFSIGLSEYPTISDSKEELVSHAGLALYQAKNMGEDKVNFYQDIMLQVNKNTKTDEQMVGVFRGLLSTINAKDKYTVGHCERVASYASMIGEAMGLDLIEIQTLLSAGLLHDIGKIELPKMVLNKPGRLTDEEFELIRQHPIHSANILEPLSRMHNLIDYVRHHHERYDGKGYPDGIMGEEISLGARILCVADSFDAMVSDRPYRKSMSIEEAFLELERCAGSQFDPEVTRVFIRLMRNKMSIKYNYKVEIGNTFIKKPVLQKS